MKRFFKNLLIFSFLFIFIGYTSPSWSQKPDETTINLEKILQENPCKNEEIITWNGTEPVPECLMEQAAKIRELIFWPSQLSDAEKQEAKKMKRKRQEYKKAIEAYKCPKEVIKKWMIEEGPAPDCVRKEMEIAQELSDLPPGHGTHVNEWNRQNKIYSAFEKQQYLDRNIAYILSKHNCSDQHNNRCAQILFDNLSILKGINAQIRDAITSDTCLDIYEDWDGIETPPKCILEQAQKVRSAIHGDIFSSEATVKKIRELQLLQKEMKNIVKLTRCTYEEEDEWIQSKENRMPPDCLIHRQQMLRERIPEGTDFIYLRFETTEILRKRDRLDEEIALLIKNSKCYYAVNPECISDLHNKIEKIDQNKL